MLHFIVFGSHARYIEQARTLIESARQLQIFDTLKLFTGDDLKKTSFWKIHKNFVERNRRGYGYWLWKPYLIKEYMKDLKDGDILLYLDSDCKININERDYLLECIENVKTEHIVGTRLLTEDNWTKMDLILKLEMNDSKYLQTPIRQAGLVLYHVCDKTRNLVDDWYNIGCNYNMIDDSPSKIKNLSCFKEHRHDQSIFSLLTKKYNLYSDMDLSKKCIRT